jgi:hypothetical protein
MPGLDRTGPEGQGPTTGRGLGRCRKQQPAGNDVSENTPRRRFNSDETGQGQGLGAGRGRRRGLGRGLGRGNR